MDYRVERDSSYTASRPDGLLGSHTGCSRWSLLDSTYWGDSWRIKRLTRTGLLVLGNRLLGGVVPLTMGPQGRDFKEHTEEGEHAKVVLDFVAV